MDKIEFGRRISQLRIAKGVSAREMSLDSGQSPSYVNNIENAKNYPSTQFINSIIWMFVMTFPIYLPTLVTWDLRFPRLPLKMVVRS